MMKCPKCAYDSITGDMGMFFESMVSRIVNNHGGKQYKSIFSCPYCDHVFVSNDRNTYIKQSNELVN